MEEESYNFFGEAKSKEKYVKNTNTNTNTDCGSRAEEQYQLTNVIKQEEKNAKIIV